MRNLGEYRETVLKNGLKVVLQHTSNETAYVELKFFHSAAHERPGEEGIAHFLEHVVNNGGGQKFTLEQVKELKAYLPMTNATTNHERTRYFAELFPEDLELYLKFISDVCFNPRIDEIILNQERQRVLREIADKKGKPSFEDRKLLKEQIYGDDPRVNDVLGDEEIITSLSREKLLKFHSRGYSPNNAQLLIIGNIPEKVVDIIGSYFGHILTKTGSPFIFKKVNKFKQPGVVHTFASDLVNSANPENSNSSLDINILGEPQDAEDYFSCKMLTFVLGKGQRSRIFTKISKELGFAYRISSNYYAKYVNTALININGKIIASKQQEAIDTIFNEFKKLQEEQISEEELNNFKRNFKFRVLGTSLNLEGISHLVNRRLKQGFGVDEYLKRFEEITPKQIQDAAIKYLPSSREDKKYVMLLRDPLKG